MAFLAGEAFIPVLPNATGFSALLAKQVNPAIGKMETGIKGAVSRIAGNVTGLGTSIGTSFGLGLAVAGVAAGKMALDFENAFTKIAALSNSSAADIERWKGEVLDLAGTTARAPQELADALFFLSSAGLESGQVMGALSVSAKAAAVGLGSTVDVANIVASSLNAYADSGLRAAEVTDTLVAAVRAGRAEPEEFANSLGKLLPIAVQAGVSFQDLTASLASLSNVGLDVDEAATAMRGALQAIAAPGSQAAEAMDQLGLSAQDLLDAISQRGLFGAFQLLDQAARDSTSSQADYIGVLRKVIPNVRALTGILGLTGQEAAKVGAVFQQTSDSTGDLNTAFQTWLKGPGAQIAKLFNEMKVAAIQFGENILPVAQTLARLLTPVLKLAAGSAGELLTAFLAYKTLTFLPVLIVKIATALETVGIVSTATAGSATLLATGLASMAGPAALATVGIVGLGLALAHFTGHDERTFDVLGDSLAKLAEKVHLAGGAVLAEVPVFQKAFGPANLLTGTIGDLASEAGGATGPLDALGGAVDTLAASHEKAAQSALDQLNAELALAGNLTGILGSLQSAATASDDLAAARRHLDQLTNRGKQGSKEYRKAIDDVAAAELSALDAQLNLAGAVESYASAVASGEVKQKDAIAQLKTFGAEAGLTKGEIADMLDTLRDAIRDYQALAKAPNINKTVDADTRPANAALTALEARVKAFLAAPHTGTIDLLVNVRGDSIAHLAHGFHGVIDRPTLFVAGEAGRERVDVTPGGGGGGGGTGSGRISGQLAITSWHRGLMDMQAEFDNLDRTSGR